MEPKRSEVSPFEMTPIRALTILNDIVFNKVSMTGKEHQEARFAIQTLAKALPPVPIPKEENENAGNDKENEA